MKNKSIRFLNLIMVALVTGATFGIWLGYNPKDLSSATYIEQHQNAVRALNTLMPVLGMIGMLLTIISAFLHRKEKSVFVTLWVAVFFLIMTGLATRFGNQPINAIIMTWDMNSAPDNWMRLRDEWWTYHTIRTFTGITALCLIAWTSIRKD